MIVIMISSWLYLLVGSIIVIVSWAIENNLVYLRSILVYDCDYDKLLVISTGWVVIMIVSWGRGIT